LRAGELCERWVIEHAPVKCPEHPSPNSGFAVSDPFAMILWSGLSNRIGYAQLAKELLNLARWKGWAAPAPEV
jgi:hypothetical protein